MKHFYSGGYAEIEDIIKDYQNDDGPCSALAHEAASIIKTQHKHLLHMRALIRHFEYHHYTLIPSEYWGLLDYLYEAEKT